MDIIEIYDKQEENLILNMFKLGDKFFVEENAIEFLDDSVRRRKIMHDGACYLNITNSEFIDIIYILDKNSFKVILNGDDIINTLQAEVDKILEKEK